MNGQFKDKVYACWTGKNIGGTLGGPLEGRMDLLDIDNYTQSFVEAIENDDLDLQLVNLHCVEQYGGVVTSERLAQEWVSHVHFQYDEYGHSLTNMRLGLRPMISGKYNNFFTDCMGSPIRSELWAILCAGMPDMAAYYAFQDASVDHAGGEGVYGEIFFAVFESLAFFSTDINDLIHKALSYIPKDCGVAKAVACLINSKAKGHSWQEARQRLIDNFGGENFTYAPINIAFTLIGLLYGEGFTERLLITTNCGYDTDCTCATIASMMGILYGSAYIDAMWTEPLGEKIIISPPVNGFDAPKTISELTERTISAHRLITALYDTANNRDVFTIDTEVNKEITLLPAGSFFDCDYYCETIYEDNHPAIAPMAEKRVTLKIRNNLIVPKTLRISAEENSGFSISGGGVFDILPNEEVSCGFKIKASGQKLKKYSGSFKIAEEINGSIWAEYNIPFVLLPTQDWVVWTDEGEKQIIHLTDSRIPMEEINRTGAKTFNAAASIDIPVGKLLRLIVCCRQPLDLYVDGELRASCEYETREIPAYHRADRRKCADIMLSAGPHLVEIKVKRADEIKNLFFYIVDPKNCSLELGCLTLPSA